MVWNKAAREPLQGKVKPSQLPQGPHGRALCRWCQNEVRPKRRTFCGAPCVHEHKLRSSIDYMKNQVFERDAGRCALCDLDCVALLRSTQSLAAAEGEGKALQVLIEKGFNPFRAAQSVQKGAALWDADHIVAVSQGGGGCGPFRHENALCALPQGPNQGFTTRARTGAHSRPNDHLEFYDRVSLSL